MVGTKITPDSRSPLHDAPCKAAILFAGTGHPAGWQHRSIGKPIKQPLQTDLCRLFFKFGQLTRLPGSTRLSCLNVPVETFTPPYMNGPKISPFRLVQCLLPPDVSLPPRACRRAFYPCKARPRLLCALPKSKNSTVSACNPFAKRRRKV